MTDNSPKKYSSQDAKQWVDLYGDRLYRYALSRINKVEVAQDLVQETFLSAFKAREQYRGEASEFSWLISILKNKIMDFLRAKYKTRSSEQINIDDLSVDHLFKMAQRECHKKSPSNWIPNPNELLEKKEFWKIFEMCLGKLAAVGAQAFTMREVEHMNVKEICNILGITTSNLYVLLHRARSLLRDCIDTHWIKA